MTPIKLLLAPYKIEVDAWPCGVPGLAITRAIDLSCVTPSWTVTHVRSGGALWRCIGDPEGALHAAQQLGSLADWTLSADELVATPGLNEGVQQLRPHQHPEAVSQHLPDLNRITP